MKESPIIFSTEMVKAILDGRKTQTRRVIVPQPTNQRVILTNHPRQMPTYTADNWIRLRDDTIAEIGSSAGRRMCPYGQVGDRLWVRETFYYDESAELREDGLFYKADEWMRQIVEDAGEKWRPSIFMPKWAARIWLKITDVRVERLQEITIADAGNEIGWDYSYPIPDHALDGHEFRFAFHKLWDSLNAKRGYSWESNPWVWVTEFRRVE